MKNRESIALSASRWTAYSAAGIAAATAGTMTSEAEAAITVIESNTVVGVGGGTFSFAFEGGAGFLAAVFPLGVSSSGGAAVALGMAGGQMAGFSAGYIYASNLAYGAALSTANFGIGSNQGTLAFNNGYGNDQFLAAGTAYLGFRFDNGGGTQYAWAELNMDGAPLNSFTVVRYAYGAVGDSVSVGQVPAPGSMAALALGAAGLGGFRRRRSA